MAKKTSVWVIVVVLIVIAGGFLLFGNSDSSDTNLGSSSSGGASGGSNINDDSSDSEVDWRTFQFTDVKTGDKFSISDFEGTPVLMESFAVWCPTCTKQQQNVKALHEDLGDAFVSISLDTDPNEDASKVLDHINRNGFNWRYAIAPAEVTQDIVDEFGLKFTFAPGAPIVLIDETGNARLLKSGSKSPEDLKSELNL